MTSTKKVLMAFVAMTLLAVAISLPVSAGSSGEASIGFSSGTIEYIPMGISGIQNSLGFSFGEHVITNNAVTQTYPSLNKAGYVVSNETGGTGGYTVTLGLSSFDRGLEGASLTMYADENGLVSDRYGAVNPPILMENQGYVELEADDLSTAVIMQGFRSGENPMHTALGRWGSNFVGELKVFTNTILVGESKAVMTWELTIA